MNGANPSTPSGRRLFGFCLVAAIVAFLAFVWVSFSAWLMLPVAVVVLALLSGIHGYWWSRGAG